MRIVRVVSAVLGTLIIIFVVLSLCNGKPLITSERWNIFPMPKNNLADVVATFGTDSVYCMLLRYRDGHMLWPVIGFGGNGLIASFQEDSPLGLYSLEPNHTISTRPLDCNE